jgi:glycosyltransferase involved in cell wall biosynthesis
VTPDGRGAPWLSVLVPVYNVAEWIGPCVQSLLAQPLEGVEVILLDDASTDASRAICEHLCAIHAPTLRLLWHAGNRGLSAARNTMLAAARGRYVWFVDGDDEMLPGAIAGLREVILRHEPQLVLCDYTKLGRHEAGFSGPRRRLEHDPDALLRGLFESRRMHVWTKIAQRELWDAAPRFPEGSCYEDLATMPWLMLGVRSYYYVPEPWIAYRTRAGSITALAAHTRGHFDMHKNEDVARALTGFVADARAALPGLTPRTLERIGQFCAKEFTKIAWRLIKHRLLRDDWRLIVWRMRHFRRLLESCSPLPFAKVAWCNLRDWRVRDFLRLQVFRFMARRDLAPGAPAPTS